MKPWVLPVSVGVIVIAAAGVFVCQSSAVALVAGTVFQVSGAAMALVGVRDLSRQFHKPSLLDGLKAKLLRPRRDATVNVVGLTSTVSVGSSLDVSLRRPVTAEQPIEEIVARVNYNIEQLTTELADARNELRNAAARLESRIGEENAQRAMAVAALQQDLESATTGGLDLTVAGLWCVIAGTVLSALPGLGIFGG